MRVENRRFTPKMGEIVADRTEENFRDLDETTILPRSRKIASIRWRIIRPRAFGYWDPLLR